MGAAQRLAGEPHAALLMDDGAGWSEPTRQSPRQQQIAKDRQELGRSQETSSSRGAPGAALRCLPSSEAAAAASDASETDARSASSGRE